MRAARPEDLFRGIAHRLKLIARECIVLSKLDRSLANGRFGGRFVYWNHDLTVVQSVAKYRRSKYGAS
jgi:hypothetical protein